MKVQIALGDKRYVADVAEMFQQMTIGQIRAIKRETGMTSTMLQKKVLELGNSSPTDPDDENWDVYTALVYVLMSRSDWHVTWADVERIPLVDIASGWSVLDDEPTEPVTPVTSVELPQGEPVTVNG